VSAVIVTGSREWIDRETLEEKLGNACPSVVVQGGCPTGADAMARDWARRNGINSVTYHANWKLLGKRAGPERNGRMLAAYPNAHVLAFPLGGPGTRDCINQANNAKMAVSVYVPKGT
jgi:hypothetical protein